MKVPDDKLRSMLGIASVTFKQNEQRLAIIDSAARRLREHVMTLSNTLRSIMVAAALGGATAGMAGGGRYCPAGRKPRRRPSAVSIDNFTFTPQTLTVKAGTTVTWTNRDDIPHGIAADQQRFARSKALDTDDSYSFTFTTPGTYQYFCYIHPHMTGTIVVEPQRPTMPRGDARSTAEHKRHRQSSATR